MFMQKDIKYSAEESGTGNMIYLAEGSTGPVL